MMAAFSSIPITCGTVTSRRAGVFVGSGTAVKVGRMTVDVTMGVVWMVVGLGNAVNVGGNGVGGNGGGGSVAAGRAVWVGARVGLGADVADGAGRAGARVGLAAIGIARLAIGVAVACAPPADPFCASNPLGGGARNNASPPMI